MCWQRLGNSSLTRTLVLTASVAIQLAAAGSLAFAGQAELLGTIDISQLSEAECPGPGCIASPDPAGITYLPASESLLLADSEVDEISALFTGDNLFDITLSGLLRGTLSTMAFSSEPAGVTLNPRNGHLFFADDTADRIFELAPGADGLYNTSDDSLSFFDTRAFLSFDPEGLAYLAASQTGNQDTLFIADGVSARVFTLTPGTNGVFDGLAPAGDDEVTSFGVTGDGLVDIEGMALNPANGHLYLVGRPNTMLAQYTTEGRIVRIFDISAADPVAPSGLTFAPGSLSPSALNLYIADRGVDNLVDPEENDGRIYEMLLPDATPGNEPPVVDAGLDREIQLPVESVELNGTVSDDGIPNPPGVTVTTWRVVSGPGSVTFANAASPSTVASFSGPGTYVLRLAADDGEWVESDDVLVTVFGLAGELAVEVRIAKGSDDAEERFNGNVAIGSVDLEMVDTLEGDGGNQVVGLRFEEVPVPQDSEIVRAHVQLRADETHDQVTQLSIRGERVGDSATFVQDNQGGGGLSSRSKTAAAVSWSPPAWIAKEAGPAQQTPDVSAVLQEIVSQSTWSSGNALALFVEGSGKRVADSADGSPAPPRLHLEFITPACPDQSSLSNLTVTEEMRFRASSSITVGPDFTVADGGGATFKTAGALVFGDGFTVLEDGEMCAAISPNPCD
jgi:hypothetical protein